MQQIINLKKYLNKPLKQKKQIFFYKIKKRKFYEKEKYKSHLRVTKSFDRNPLIKEGGQRVKGCYKYSLKQNPLITIVTVVLNNEKDLENTIKSVLLQKYVNIEYIIIDGGSKGSVIAKIKKYEDFIDYWISQKDKGIFDAYNKALRLANGDYICFLNVGDYFTEKALDYIIKKIKNKKLDVIFGSVKKNIIHTGFNINNIRKSLNIFPSLTSSFINHQLFKKNGLFNLKYSCYNDYEFIYRVIKTNKLNYLTTNKNQLITVFDLKGYSSRVNFFRQLYEEFRIRYQYEHSFLIFVKLASKLLGYFFLKYTNQKKFKKYNY